MNGVTAVGVLEANVVSEEVESALVRSEDGSAGQNDLCHWSSSRPGASPPSYLLQAVRFHEFRLEVVL